MNDHDAALIPFATSTSVDGPRGVIRLHRHDVYRRLPILEAWAANHDIPVAAVWAVFHATEADDQALRAMVTLGQDGKPHVFVNFYRAQCPILRLGLLHHELQHVESGDLWKPGGYNPFAETDCEKAAVGAIAGAAKLAMTKGSAAPVDAAQCMACYLDNASPCRQGDATFAEVKRVLSLY